MKNLLHMHLVVLFVNFNIEGKTSTIKKIRTEKQTHTWADLILDELLKHAALYDGKASQREKKSETKASINICVSSENSRHLYTSNVSGTLS